MGKCRWVLDGEGREAIEAWYPIRSPSWLEKAIGWYREGVAMAEIARRLNEEGIAAPWSGQGVDHQ